MKKTKEKKKINLLRIIYIIEWVIFYTVIVPMIIICFFIAYQKIEYPKKIPNIFGYKIFMIMNEFMDESVEYGDVVFAKNVKIDDYQIGDIMAFRNGMNTITIHRINEINTSIADNSKEFKMHTIQNETDDTKHVREINVEGKVVYKISKIGFAIMVIREPLVFALIMITVLIVGMISYYIAQKLDERDIEKLNQNIDERL